MSPLRYAFLGYCTAEGAILIISDFTGYRCGFYDFLLNVKKDVFSVPGK